jgi:hypothetical protein
LKPESAHGMLAFYECNASMFAVPRVPHVLPSMLGLGGDFFIHVRVFPSTSISGNLFSLDHISLLDIYKIN